MSLICARMIHQEAPNHEIDYFDRFATSLGDCSAKGMRMIKSIALCDTDQMTIRLRGIKAKIFR